MECGLPGCSIMTTMKCAGCGVVAYCSRKHQKGHWKTHKADCQQAAAGENDDALIPAAFTAVRCGAVEKTSIILWVEKEDATVAKKMLCHNVPLFAALHVRMVNLESLFKNVTEVREEEGGVRM